MWGKPPLRTSTVAPESTFVRSSDGKRKEQSWGLKPRKGPSCRTAHVSGDKNLVAISTK
jgi:hypothetical protein